MRNTEKRQKVGLLCWLTINEISGLIIGAAMRIHRELGPGLLVSVYESALAMELEQRGLQFKRQQEIPVVYRGKTLDVAFRADLTVEGRVLVEIKSIVQSAPIHSRIVLTYLRLTKCPIALILNFNVNLMKEGIQRLGFSLCPL